VFLTGKTGVAMKRTLFGNPFKMFSSPYLAVFECDPLTALLESLFSGTRFVTVFFKALTSL
jgi:hypothetical protein